MDFKCYFLALFLAQFCAADSDDRRWVWGSGRKDERYTAVLVNNDRKYTGQLVGPSRPLFQPASGLGGSAQATGLKYEVVEPQPGPQDPYIPVRPGGGYRPRPDGFRPQPGYKPIRPIENEYPVGPGLRPPPIGQQPGGYRPMGGPNGRPILTGPVPSWQQENPNAYKEYDKCKCVHSFNCNTPGIKFGSCDVDKQYCCYKAKRNEIQNGIGRPVPQKPRPVLAGPGGPVDRPQGPGQSIGSYGRPFRPFSDIDRFVESERDLDEAYMKGLQSAIYELYDRPSTQYQAEEQSLNSYNKPPTMGYGLYDPSSPFARSGSSNITAIEDS